MLLQNRENCYPNLRLLGYKVTSSDTIHSKVRYNCVAWAALGDTGTWWQPGNEPGFFWPPGVPDDGTFESYVELFRALNYVECDNDRLEFSYEKVALYGDTDGEFSHVAYQLFSGWTSKLGNWEDIKHANTAALEDGYYGTVRVIMRCRCSLRGFLARAFFNLTARVWPQNREQVFHRLIIQS